ncbi:MAG: hypothetical protein ACFB9N_18420 [Geitlerinemataceae cyanobacterium]
MGTASTGEEVYYEWMDFLCGDLPLDDSCWRSPTVSYTIGADSVLAETDCDNNVFSTVWTGGEVVAENMAPQSEAIAEIISLACYAATGR